MRGLEKGHLLNQGDSLNPVPRPTTMLDNFTKASTHSRVAHLRLEKPRRQKLFNAFFRWSWEQGNLTLWSADLKCYVDRNVEQLLLSAVAGVTTDARHRITGSTPPIPRKNSHIL
jgi:hypothetical protein